jgi:hypothetical protein
MLDIGIVRLDKHRLAQQLCSLLVQAARPVEVCQVLQGGPGMSGPSDIWAPGANRQL